MRRTAWAWVKDYAGWLFLAVGVLLGWLFGRYRNPQHGGDSSGVDEYRAVADVETDRIRNTIGAAERDSEIIEAQSDRAIGIIHAAANDNERASRLLAELRKRSGDSEGPEEGTPVGAGR